MRPATVNELLVCPTTFHSRLQAEGASIVQTIIQIIPVWTGSYSFHTEVTPIVSAHVHWPK